MSDPGTNTKTQLASLLRTCIQCGLCLPHCATWLATGSEVQSPRGRLLLLEDLLNKEDSTAAAPAAFLAAFDQCIGCRACETACPSGVPFSLLEYGQGLAMDRIAKGALEVPRSAVPGFVMRRLDSPAVLHFLRGVAGATSSIFSTLFGGRWRRRLDRSPAGVGRLVRLLGSLPSAPETDEQLCALLDGLLPRRSSLVEEGREIKTEVTSANPLSVNSPRVVFFRGCANAGLLPGSSRRLLELLRAVGCEVEIPIGQDCCGALASHTGRLDRAADLHAANRAAFADVASPETCIIVEAAGCGLELKEHLGDLADKVNDAVDLLSQLPLPDFGTVPLKVVVHDPCHARHGQGIYRQPRELLARIPGLTLLEAPESEVCCGSGGAWGLRYPELSETLGRRKAEHLAATGADLIVTSNPGCLGQIADGLALIAPEVPILPLTDLLWYATKRAETVNS